MQSSDRRLSWLPISLTLLFVTGLLPGCASHIGSDVANEPNGQNTVGTQPATKSSYVAVDNSTYDSKSETVTLQVHELSAVGAGKNPIGEQVIDVSTNDGPINYASTQYSTQHIKTVRLMYPHQKTRSLPVPSELTTPNSDAETTIASSIDVTTTDSMEPDAVEALSGSVLPRGASRSGHVPIPPPGATIDHSIYWRVKLSAPVWMKENAVINEARSKLGTPYIWGHNEDRGQYGFDCSNFTAYVYHHALGYKFTGASRGQAKYVGVRVPISDMRRGDLIILENGKHVGIYAGNHRMIQEGGGLGKVGYLPLGPGSYWGKHITSVKRLF